MALQILSWNILSGGFKDYGSLEKRPGRIDSLARVIKEVKPDVVSLVDTYRWTEVFTIDELKQIFEYPVVFMVKLEDPRLIDKGHDNGITVFSNDPDTTTEAFRLVTRNAIKTRISGIDIFSVYFDDISEDTRIKQVHAVLDLVNTSRPTLITGDLNTFDKHDLSEAESNLDELSRRYPGPIKSMEASLNEMKRGEVTQILKDNGFKDLGINTGNTVPARLFPLPVERPVIRLDYAFGNSMVKLEDFKVLTDEKYANLSDHYPILLRISSL